jgi:acetyl-CoA C-acetyltransferase
MTIDPHTPVLLGAGQFTEHLDEAFSGLPPEELAAEACRAALADSGAEAALGEQVDRLACVRLFAHSVPEPLVTSVAPFGRSTSPPLSILKHLSLPNAQAIYSRACGDEPQRLVYEMGAAIERGEIRAAIICGAEALATTRLFQRQGHAPDWSDDPEGETDDRGACIELLFDAELNRHGAFAPVDIYPLQEQARRGELGLSKAAYREQLARLMAQFAAVAADNPYAMFRESMSAEEIGLETTKNRLMGDPHLKSMVAKDGVNQAAALVMTRYETAVAHGVADRAVFLHGHATGSEPQVLVRPALGRAASMTAAYVNALTSAGIIADEIGAADLYSCFPIAVWAAMDALGIELDDPRPLTLTGGLPFFGGPGNNYSTHGIVEMIHWLRRQPDKRYGIVGANGGYLSKHAVGVYSNAPGTFPDPVPETEATDSVELVRHAEADGVIESYTYKRKGDTSRAIIIGRQVSDGRRWVGVADPDDSALLAWFEEGEPLGAQVNVITGERNIVRRLT